MIDSMPLLLTLAAAAAWGLTALVRAYARRHLMDVPNSRSSHGLPTPRGGGLGVVLTWYSALWLLPAAAAGGGGMAEACAAGVAVAAVGFVDDHGHLSPRLRIAVHVAAAGWALWWLGGMPSITLGGQAWHLGWAGSALALVAIVWMLNLFNFMDGIDGIAGSEGVFVAGAGGILNFVWFPESGQGLLNLVLAASCAGFLLWNWPPAAIFLGDVGSSFIGFILGVAALASAARGGASLAVWAILAAVFVADASFTLLRRMASGQRWFEAHRSHAYQHAVLRLGGHRPVTLWVWAINLGWLLPLALLALRQPQAEPALLFLAYAPLLALVAALGAGRTLPPVRSGAGS